MERKLTSAPDRMLKISVLSIACKLCVSAPLKHSEGTKYVFSWVQNLDNMFSTSLGATWLMGTVMKYLVIAKSLQNKTSTQSQEKVLLQSACTKAMTEITQFSHAFVSTARDKQRQRFPPIPLGDTWHVHKINFEAFVTTFQCQWNLWNTTNRQRQIKKP